MPLDIPASCWRDDNTRLHWVPYLHAGGDHEYLPDFIARMSNGINLILETKGHDELEEVKKQAAHRWVRAVSADGIHGRWHYEITYSPPEIPQILERVAALDADLEVSSR